MSEPQREKDIEAPPPSTPAGRCSFCGAFTALELGDSWICESCYQERGSCCTERPGEGEPAP
jgi:hypothetical protein